MERRRLDVQEAQGSSTLTLRVDGRQAAGRFNGSTQGAVLAYILKDAGRYSGRIRGDMRFAADLDRLRHASAEGQLSDEGLDLGWLAGRRLLVDRFAIEADGNAMRIGEASVSAGEDRATLRGELRRGEQGPSVDASIESEGIVLDRCARVRGIGRHATRRRDPGHATRRIASRAARRAHGSAAWWSGKSIPLANPRNGDVVGSQDASHLMNLIAIPPPGRVAIPASSSWTGSTKPTHSWAN